MESRGFEPLLSFALQNGEKLGSETVIVACAVDVECCDAENLSAERATIASIASAAKMKAALNRNHFLPNPLQASSFKIVTAPVRDRDPGA